MPKTGVDGIPSWVYFVQAGSDGPIKIGVSADPVRRLHLLQTNHYAALSILGVIPGDQRLEAHLHVQFREWRIRDEWFEPVAELLDYIALASSEPPRKRDHVEIALRTGQHPDGWLVGEVSGVFEDPAQIA